MARRYIRPRNVEAHMRRRRDPRDRPGFYSSGDIPEGTLGSTPVEQFATTPERPTVKIVPEGPREKAASGWSHGPQKMPPPWGNTTKARLRHARRKKNAIARYNEMMDKLEE